MAGPSYKRLLASVLPYALIGAGEDADALYLMQQVDAILSAPRERVMARQKTQYAAHPGPAKDRAKGKHKPTERRRERYLEVHEFNKEKGRQYAAKRKETGKAAAYRKSIRQEHRQRSKERTARADEGYARELLAKNSPLRGADFHLELVKLKQAEIKLRRALK